MSDLPSIDGPHTPEATLTTAALPSEAIRAAKVAINEGKRL